MNGYADWLIHNAGRGTDLTGMSGVQGYHLGDIDESGAIDVIDFVLFKQRFEETNGAGSFAAMIAIPEPSTLELLAGTLLFFGTMRRAGSRRWHARAIRQTSKLS